MKILIFSPYYPPHIGGLESHADEFNKHMSKHVKKIVVFTPRLPQDAPEIETRFENVEIIRFPAFEIISNYPVPKLWTMTFWNQFLGLFKQDFDVVISRTRFFLTSLLALVYAKIKRKRWIHIEHGSDFVKLQNKISSFLAKSYDYTFGKLTLMLADKLIANSKASSEFCKKLAPKKYCEIIYRGVETEKINNISPDINLKEKYSGKKIITFIGRLIDGKGVHDLLASAKDLGENFVIFIVGDGPQRKNLQKISAACNIENKVVFFGHKNWEEAIGILKISDIFINPSYTEGLPTSVIEAAICKIPVIATNVGGTPEISTKIPLIDSKDISALTHEIKKLFNNDNSSNNKDLICTEVKNRFDWEKNIGKYLNIFNKL